MVRPTSLQFRVLNLTSWHANGTSAWVGSGGFGAVRNPLPVGG